MRITKKLISFWLVFLLFLGTFPFDAFASSHLDVSARSACLIEAKSGSVLYEKNASQKLPMASTTKIMTAIIALESEIPLDKIIKIPACAVGVEGSSLYLNAGEGVSFEALLYGLLLCSANDAAVAIAHTVCGSVESFVEKMNEKARELSLSDTKFANPHGLHEKEHYTTARDLASLMAYCVKNEQFLAISGCTKRVFPRGDSGVRVMINHNRLLREDIGVISGKTGFTKNSGRTLVSCAEREGLRLICVTLNAPDDWNDHTSLYEFGFSNYENVNFSAISLKIPVISGKTSEIVAKSSDFSLFLPRERNEIKVKIEAPRFVFAPTEQGEQIGRVLYLYNGKIIAASPLVCTEDVAKLQYKFNLFEWLMDLIKGLIN